MRGFPRLWRPIGRNGVTMSHAQMPGQVIEMNLSGFGTCSQCGAELEDGAKISYWHSGTGKSFDKIVACPMCRRPTALLQERLWLINQLTLLRSPRSQFSAYGTTVLRPMGPEELNGAIAYLNSELDSNWQRTNTVAIKLLMKLPKCEECSEYATHQIRNGPFFCDLHSAQHSTAQKVEWALELAELGVGSRS